MNEKQAHELAQENAKNDIKLKELRDEGQNVVLTAIYDKKADVFQNIMATPASAYAVRGFIDAAKNKESAINKYPEDFALVKIATFNTKSGLIKDNMIEVLLEAATVAM